ncbi:CvpA family protein [Candidatus Desulforudis audaxviator]|uniref:Colicin V production protein n=1 Tax=Desulforudis audaxviator (strain MP104C) TaxID=477974 RepID=B1I6T5_DESAP|nr:CvpA family protein [Candidatus Desulforudis audaxviator]ACA60707.1 Colicin V production protein [Candidatus Desulforudis audaxviator MP104C]AZK60793.1 Colicin V production protein [Candidatus Desulforudis audaxviator]
MNWLDGGLVILLAFSAWRGFVRGFARSALGVVVFVLGLFVAYKYYRPAGEYLERQYDLGARLQEFVAGLVAGKEAPAAVPAEHPVAELPQSLHGIAGLVDQFLAGQLEGMGREVIASTVAPSALDAVTFVGLFFVTVWLGGVILSRVPHLPLLGPIDRAGGFCFGLARGFMCGLVVLVALKILSFPSALLGPGFLSDGLDGSQLAAAYFAFLHYIWAFFTPVPR